MSLLLRELYFKELRYGGYGVFVAAVLDAAPGRGKLAKYCGADTNHLVVYCNREPGF